MNPVTRDFVRRWNWLLLIQFAATTIGWIMHAQGSKLHFEMFPAVAMSFDLVRGLIRSCLGLPLARPVLARGLWFAVAAVSPVLTIASMILATIFCMLCSMTPPPGNALTFHLVVSVLLSGTMQFLLSSLPTRPAASVPERIRDILVGLGWGLSISATLWISFLLPAGWDGMGTSSFLVLGLLAVLTVTSWFTTRSMLARRAVTRPAAVSPSITNSPKSALAGSGGWKLWLELEIGSLAPVCFMILIFMALTELMARASSSGVSTAMKGSGNMYMPLAMMCAMIIIPLFARATGPARVFQAMPITRGRHALLLAARPVIFCLVLVAIFTVVSVLSGRATGEEGRAFGVFILIGNLMSLMQAINVRHPRFPVAFGIGIFLAPAVLVTFPLFLQSGGSVSWLAIPGLALFPLSWLLHRRWLRTSSQFYRSQQWLMRFAAGNPR
jgi:hypothetical protein